MLCCGRTFWNLPNRKNPDTTPPPAAADASLRSTPRTASVGGKGADAFFQGFERKKSDPPERNIISTRTEQK
jgi:hypothetical protein